MIDWVNTRWKYPSINTWSLLYIIFVKFFYRLSRRSDSAPDATSFLTDYPSTCSHFSFHVLWLCSQPFPSYYDILYFYVLSSLRSRFIPTQYINWCIFLVVLQFVNWHWFSSSPILSLSFLYPLKALSTLSSLSSSSGNYITTKTNLRPSDLTSRPLTKF